MKEEHFEQNNCCGGPAPDPLPGSGSDNVKACCAMDAEAKSNGKTGCGCNDASKEETELSSCC